MQKKTPGLAPAAGADNHEFPQLAKKGLYAFEIMGDGNCMFRALSDQYYGDAGKAHASVRKTIVDYLRAHPDDFKVFIECEGEETWEQHLARMSQDGVFGDHAELVAFSRAMGVNVIIYQRDTHFLVTPDEGQLDTERDRASAAKAIRSRPTLHIAYHNWEHYSSIRKVAGPHTGPPGIDFKLRMSVDDSSSASKDKKAVKKEVASKVQVILQSCPFMGTSAHSAKLAESVLLENGVNVDKAIEVIYEDPDKYMEAPTTREEGNAQAEVSTTPTNGTINEAKGSVARKTPRKMTAREKKEEQKREQLERKRLAKKAPSIMSVQSEESVGPSIMAIPI